MRAVMGRVRSQKGVIWTLALVLLALASLVVTPAVSQISGALAGTTKLDQRLLDRYASDAGVEHALWRLQYESGFEASLNPTVTYPQTLNGRTATISVTDVTPQPPPPPSPPPQQSGDALALDVTVTPQYAAPSQFTTFTYTLYIHNYGSNTVHLDKIGDLLPPGFTYVAGSSLSTGLIFSGNGPLGEPDVEDEDGRQELEWEFPSPRPSIDAGVTATVSFQATATLSMGTYFNEAEVDPQGSLDDVLSGPTSPVVVRWSQFDITSAAGPITLRVRAEKPPTGMVIRSWQVQ